MFSSNINIQIENKHPYTEYGNCRCCMAKGQHKDITKEYYYNNIKEVYKEIFMECFNLSLSPHNQITPLICEGCVHRLRDASTFRKMVVASEKLLVDAIVFKSEYGCDAEFVDVTDPQGVTIEVKRENEEDDWSDNELVIDETREQKDEFLDPDDICIVDDFESAYSSIATNTTSAKHDMPFKNDERLKDLEDKLINPKSVEWIFKTPIEKNISMPDKEALAINATTLFQYSTATAFRTKVRTGYPCYYCREVFQCDQLRKHQQRHTKSSIQVLLSKKNADEFVVYADITDLKCTICYKDMSDLNELRYHLAVEHSKKIYASADRVIPFKLKETEYDCQVCGTQFLTFGAVEKHMNSHFGTFTCQTCGASFITKHRLGVHDYLQHVDQRVICNLCKKSFRNQIKFRCHYKDAHQKVKKYKCVHCPEKFVDYTQIQQHMADVHCKPQIGNTCNMCHKTFTMKQYLTGHIRRCHMSEKKRKCEQCSFQCHTSSELKDHMIKHGEKQEIQCPYCEKTYGRKRSLAMHLKLHKIDKKNTTWMEILEGSQKKETEDEDASQTKHGLGTDVIFKMIQH